jgi:hypothetical protein
MTISTVAVISLSLIASLAAVGQGTILYDQQSTNLIEGSAPWIYQPMGQSFSPSLSAVSIVQLQLFYSDGINRTGSVLYVNVRSNSLTGPILGTTASVFVPSDFFDITNFVFSTPVSLTPGTTYYLQPAIQSGGVVSSYVTDGSYSGGTAFSGGMPWPEHNLWFREGIIVPEPQIFSLFLTSAGLFLAFRKRAARF